MFGKNPIATIGSITIFFGLLLFFAFFPPHTIKDFSMRFADPLLSSAGYIRGVFDSGDVTKAIVAENQKLKAENIELESLRVANMALRRALRFEDELGRDLLLAPVTFYGKEAGKEFLIVHRGRESGINGGEPVIDENGVLVGVVRDTGNKFAKIEVISNPGETFEVEILPLGVKALARGIGNRTISLELLPIDAPVKRGDYVNLIGIENTGGARYHIPMGEVTLVKMNGSSAFKSGNVSILSKPEILREVFMVFSTPAAR
jgi:cell shape-determining protein MreC